MKVDGYHIHVYCTPEKTKIAQAVREKMLAELSVIAGAGPVRNRPVGPHPLPMFEAWFAADGINQVLPWILENREGLTVLIHPLTGNDYDDHALHAIWIGEKLNLDLEFLKNFVR